MLLLRVGGRCFPAVAMVNVPYGCDEGPMAITCEWLNIPRSVTVFVTDSLFIFRSNLY